MLADAATVADGKLYIHGGGWNFLNVFRKNASRPITIAGRVIAPWSDVEREITLDISLEHRRGDEILEDAPLFRINMESQSSPQRPDALETATPFSVEVPGIGFLEPGEYAFVVKHENQELARIRLQVNFVENEGLAVSTREDPGLDQIASNASFT
jgi:hypothetical protein